MPTEEVKIEKIIDVNWMDAEVKIPFYLNIKNHREAKEQEKPVSIYRARIKAEVQAERFPGCAGIDVYYLGRNGEYIYAGYIRTGESDEWDVTDDFAGFGVNMAKLHIMLLSPNCIPDRYRIKLRFYVTYGVE